jgi:hypothetical protein
LLGRRKLERILLRDFCFKAILQEFKGFVGGIGFLVKHFAGIFCSIGLKKLSEVNMRVLLL